MLVFPDRRFERSHVSVEIVEERGAAWMNGSVGARGESHDGFHIVSEDLRARTFSFNRASLTGFDLGVGKGGADTLSSGMVSSCDGCLLERWISGK